MPAIKEIYFKNWEEFKEEFEGYDFSTREYIFRGHSNHAANLSSFRKWELISSFNRNQQNSGYSFINYLSQQFDEELFRITYGDYLYKNIDLLSNSTLLHKCYFFQHYGIPTCFIDFTFDPFVALYFGLTGLVGRSGGAYDLNGNPLFYSSDITKDFISIYKLDVNAMQTAMNIKQIDGQFCWQSLDQFLIQPTQSPNFSAHVGLDLNPNYSGMVLMDNFNLIKQKGCFLYYDNENVNISFEKLVELFFLKNKIESSSPLITIYNIGYNSLFKKMHSRQPDSMSVFNYLRNRQTIGKYLFNDMQGLKYDFNFFHNE